MIDSCGTVYSGVSRAEPMTQCHCHDGPTRQWPEDDNNCPVTVPGQRPQFYCLGIALVFWVKTIFKDVGHSWLVNRPNWTPDLHLTKTQTRDQVCTCVVPCLDTVALVYFKWRGSYSVKILLLLLWDFLSMKCLISFA